MGSIYAIIGTITAAGSWWIWFCLNHFKITDISGILPSDMAYVIFAAALPVALLLMAGAIAVSAISHRSAAIQTRIAARALKESEIQSRAVASLLKLGFASQYFAAMPFVMAELASAMAEIMSKTAACSDVVIYDALSKKGENKLYAVAGALVSAAEATPHFATNLRRAIRKDADAGELARKFAAKYQRLMTSLRAHDPDGVLFDAIDGGIIGRAYIILASAMAAGKDED
ncbi:MAG: hypothetical protein LBT92_00605 [Rickettsiales bacterium]|nr:hypothetical protein [Rickettsiales bacterium]